MANSCPSKKAMFVMKRGEYLRKYNIFEVDFDSGVCISMGCIHKKKEYMTSHPSFILQISIFVQKSLKMGQNGPLYREICLKVLQNGILHSDPLNTRSGHPDVIIYVISFYSVLCKRINNNKGIMLAQFTCISMAHLPPQPPTLNLNTAD